MFSPQRPTPFLLVSTQQKGDDWPPNPDQLYDVCCNNEPELSLPDHPGRDDGSCHWVGWNHL